MMFVAFSYVYDNKMLFDNIVIEAKEIYSTIDINELEEYIGKIKKCFNVKIINWKYL